MWLLHKKVYKMRSLCPPSILPAERRREMFLNFPFVISFCPTQDKYGWRNDLTEDAFQMVNMPMRYLDSLGKFFWDCESLPPFHSSLKAWLPHNLSTTKHLPGSSWFNFSHLLALICLSLNNFCYTNIFVISCLSQEVVTTKVGAVTGLLYRLEEPADGMKSILTMITELQRAFYSPLIHLHNGRSKCETEFILFQFTLTFAPLIV